MSPLTRLLAAPRLLPFLTILSLFALGHTASAATLTVPTQYTTIQAAINASQNGDTVLISDGTYTGPGNVDLDFGGRNITVTSVNGAASTIIDCKGLSSNDGSGDHRGFIFHSGETNAIIIGLTIKDGYESGYAATYLGGGVAIASGSTVALINCLVTGNNAHYGGGGVNTDYGGTLTMTSCTVTGNNGGYLGGGVENSGVLKLNNCTVTGNSANDAGGVYNSGTMTLTNCIITANKAANGDNSGGGIYNDSGSGALTNCTVTGNTANAYNGGGIYNHFGTLILTNDIFYGDIGSEIGLTQGTVTASYCDVQGGFPGVGNINADPRFVNAPNDLHLTSLSPCIGAGTSNGAPAADIAGNLRPNPPSSGAYEFAAAKTTSTTLTSNFNPSIAGQTVTFTATVTGSDGIPTGNVTFILDGSALTPVTLTAGQAVFTTSALSVSSHSLKAIYNGDPNFAASASGTLIQTVISHIGPQYVSLAGKDTNDGSQVYPKLTIQAGINATRDGDTVLIANGTYTGPGNVDLDFGGRNITVTSQNGAANCIIDCNGTIRTVAHRGFNLHSGEVNAIISGLTIKNGYEYSEGVYSAGGGVSNSSVLTMANCILMGNEAGFYGGAVFNSGTLTLTNCTVLDNYADEDGGGIYNAGQLTLTGCVFTGNTAFTNGGGIYNVDTVSLTGCTVTGDNTNNGDGGGVYNAGALTLTNCNVINNAAKNSFYGGGIYNAGNATLTNCTATDNIAGIGGVVFNANGSTGILTNCTLTGNTTGFGGIVFNGGALTLTNDILYGDTGGEIGGGNINPSYCDIQGGYPGTGNINADPLFVYPPNMGAPADLHLRSNSPCLGAGNSSAPGYLPYAADFQPRPNPPSIGAFELETERLVITHIAFSLSGGVVTVTANINNYGNFTASMVRITQARLGAVTANGPFSRPYVIPAGGVQPITLTFTTGASGRLPLSIKGTSPGVSFSAGQFVVVP